MQYRTILAELGTASLAAKVLPVATRLALAQNAHLIGLHAIPAPHIPSTLGYDLPSSIVDEMRAREAKRSDEIKAVFDAAIARESSMSAEWRAPESISTDVSDIVLDQTRRADLVITGQVDEDHRAGGDFELAGTLVLESGRPILIVPYAGTVQTIGESVFVAWNGSREASRAVFDAMPFLLGASEVRLYGVDLLDTRSETPTIHGSDLAAALARHGVRAVVENASGGTGIANELLSRMADRGSDLLVMGGYGHSRARERIFGGATRDILRSMTVPVLMSH